MRWYGSLMTDFLHKLDKMKAELEGEFPGWHVWYVPRAGRGVTWCAQPQPVIHSATPDDLRRIIRHAHEDGPGHPALAKLDDYAVSAPTIMQAETLRHHSYYDDGPVVRNLPGETRHYGRP